MTSGLTEEIKERIVCDTLYTGKWTGETQLLFARYLIKLIRELDRYRRRDEKGRFTCEKGK